MLLFCDPIPTRTKTSAGAQQAPAVCYYLIKPMGVCCNFDTNLIVIDISWMHQIYYKPYFLFTFILIYNCVVRTRKLDKTI